MGWVKGITRLSIVNFQCLIEIFDFKRDGVSLHNIVIVKCHCEMRNVYLETTNFPLKTFFFVSLQTAR
jgi:hypothetical protein